MSEALPLLLTALTIGLAGSTHCVSMCGGVSTALLGVKQENTQNLFFAFHGARIVSYMTAGLLVGAIGMITTSEFAVVGIGLKLFAALLLIFVGLYMLNALGPLHRLEKIGAPLWKRLQPIASNYIPPRSGKDAAILGALWGWIPCGLVYSALGFALSSQDILLGLLIMLIFGLATIPSLWLTTMAGKRFYNLFQRRSTRAILGVTILLIGGINFLGIVHLSLSGHDHHHGHDHHTEHVHHTSN